MTGHLEYWQEVPNSKGSTVVGKVYGHESFPDGTVIQTSLVKDIGGTYVITRNSKYSLGKEAEESYV